VPRAAARIPVVLCIDVEPDRRDPSPGAPEPWRGYEGAQRRLADLRLRLAAATGRPVHFAWFLRMDPQIAGVWGSAGWVTEHHRAHLDEVARCGDEIGLHPHAFRWLPRERAWECDFGDPDWLAHVLTTSVEAYRRAFGRDCTALRWGDGWLDTESVDRAERLGVRVDLTLEPGAQGGRPTSAAPERTTAPLPDWARVPRAPYTPSRADYRRPQRGARGIRMIPLSSAHVWLGPRHRLRRRLRRLLRNGVRGRLQDTPLSMWRRWAPPDGFDRMLDRALAAQRRPYLAFAIRTDVGETLENVGACLEALLAHPAISRFAFCTPAEALAVLDRAERKDARVRCSAL
jgi:hypothetical protein